MNQILIQSNLATRKLPGRSVLVSAGVVALAIPAVYFASNHSAFASVRIKEAHGSYYVGAPTLAAGDGVFETTDGREMIRDHISGDTYKLKFAANKNLCVAIDGTSHLAVVRDRGGNNTNWTRTMRMGTPYWVYNNVRTNLDLTGRNNGTQFVGGPDGCSGCYQLFTN